MFERLITELKSLPQIEAIALGGSRAGKNYDHKSDYDVYLYCTSPIPETLRKNILNQHCSYLEIGNAFWEYEDNCTLKDGIDIDILYRNLDSFTDDLSSVVEHYHARNGYTTCMWHNLKTCKILFDRNGRLHAAKQRFNVPYPEELRKNIIQRNYALLHGHLPSYDSQILKAVNRNDRVSINHRVSAFLESYFDILFAYNRQTHPGEKRLIRLCLENCTILPYNFEKNLNMLLDNMFTEPDKLSLHLTEILHELEKIIH